MLETECNFFKKRYLNRTILNVCERQFVFDVIVVDHEELAVRLVAAVVAVNNGVAFFLLKFGFNYFYVAKAIIGLKGGLEWREL